MTRPAKLLVALAILAAAAGLSACGSSGGGGSITCPAKVDTKTATGGAITVCASDIKFDVKTIDAKAGTLAVTLENGGSIAHTLKIENTSLELKTDAGKTAKGSVTLSKGTYNFECTIPGHASLGMKGTIVVT